MSLLLVTATMATPMVVTDDLHLDGLLASAHPLCREAPLSRETPLSGLRMPPLPLQAATCRGLTLALASVAIYPETARVQTDHAVRRRDGWDIEALASPVHLGLGPGKNRMHQLPIVVTPSVSWWALGDRRGLIRLAARLTHLGGWRAAGYGVVRQWTVEKRDPAVDDPRAPLVSQGLAQRHLPFEWLDDAAEVTRAPILPPYWHPQRARDGVARAGTAVTLKRELVESCYAAADPATNREHREQVALRRRARRIGRDARRAAEGGAQPSPD